MIAPERGLVKPTGERMEGSRFATQLVYGLSKQATLVVAVTRNVPPVVLRFRQDIVPEAVPKAIL